MHLVTKNPVSFLFLFALVLFVEPPSASTPSAALSSRATAVAPPKCAFHFVVIKEDLNMFGEVQGFLVAGLSELGYETQHLTRAEAFQGGEASLCRSSGTTCISTTPCRTDARNSHPLNPLWVNLEVLDVGNLAKSWKRPCLQAGYAETLWASGPVWDYLQSNIDFLADPSRNWAEALYLPLRFFPAIIQSAVEAPVPKSIDVLFIGALAFSERRQRIIDDLKSVHNISVHVLLDTFGEEREMFVRSAKVVINVHYYLKNFETIRLFWLLSLGAFVITEADPLLNKNAMEEYSGTMVFAKYDDLVDTVHRYVTGSVAARDEVALNGFNFIRRKSPGQVLAPLLETSFKCKVA